MTEFTTIIHWIFLLPLQVVQTLYFLIFPRENTCSSLSDHCSQTHCNTGAWIHFKSMSERGIFTFYQLQVLHYFTPPQQVGCREVILHAGHKGRSILDAVRAEGMLPKKVSHHPPHYGIS